ncbi:MAG TPA: hypothetical protein VFQ53_00915 [Kofleriaceae bacterium]|nr:hypothetical protein [Kofleriaceae bacterium]
MATTLVLVALILGLLLVLEILNALYDSIIEGIAVDLARREPVPVWLAPIALVRWLVAHVLARLGGTVSLWLHELSHAAVQLVLGGRPRVVLLKNGGYAQARPWNTSPTARFVYALGGNLGRGVMCVAPILVGSALVVALLVVLTPLTAADVPAAGQSLAAHPDVAHARSLASTIWHAIAGSPWWTWPVAIAACLVLAPCMTPSTVDYEQGRVHLLAYALAAIVTSVVAARTPQLAWLLAVLAAASGLAAMRIRHAHLRHLVAGAALSTSVLALGLAVVAWRTSLTALSALHALLGTIAFALGLAAAVYVAFVVGFLALSLLALRPRTLWYTLRAVPRHLIDLVRTFDTCDRCGIHYRRRCDGCGRTPSDATTA